MGVQKPSSSATTQTHHGTTRRVTRSMSVLDKDWSNTLLESNPILTHTAEHSTCEHPAGQKPSPSPCRRSTGKTSHFHKQPWGKRKRSSGADIKLEPKAELEKTAVQPRKPQSEDHFGLIQESIAHDLYALVVQAILWNQTAGKQARPVLEQLLSEYPNPEALALARFEHVAEMLYPIGLYNNRAKRLLDMAATWLEEPPVPGRGYTRARDRKYTAVPLSRPEAERVEYDKAKTGLSDELASCALPTSDSFWEIAHLPGVGPYALDSFRIFHRDEMRGLSEDWLGKGARAGMIPEWHRVLPADKELRAYLKWLWEKEGWDWNWETGNRTKLKARRIATKHH